MKTPEIILGLVNCHHGDTLALGNGITAFKDATALRSASVDLVEVMQASGAVILAAEQIIQAAEGIALTLRRKLAETMIETGCPQVLLPHHKVSVTEPKPKLKVLDAKALPPEFTKPRAPEPDMDKIKAAHAAGVQLTGVAMCNGGPAFISFHARKD